MTHRKPRVISVDQALDLVEDGDLITVGLGANEPPTFMSNLHRIADRVSDVTVTNCLPLVEGDYLREDIFSRAFRIESWFSTPGLRRLNHTGRVSYIPNHLHLAGFKRNFHRQSAIMISLASPLGPDGIIRFATGNTYEDRIGRMAKYRIVEVSPNAPWCFGQNFYDEGTVDFIIESDAYPCTIPAVEPNEKDLAIGKLIAELINDGDCVQVGIGGIPNAVCQYLYEKKDLGVHTEMMTTGIMDLMNAGVITNSRKQVDQGKTVFAFATGSTQMYEFMHENPALWTGRGEEVNDPWVIARNDNQVSINTTIEVDLTGQCCSESVGTLQISGTGGQSDTAVGAQMSKNGRSIIALYSTHERTNRETGEVEVASKIVPTLKPGAGVTLSRNDVDWVVTEHGAVSLRGTTVAERARLLASIAHPQFRDELLAAARSFNYFI